MIPLPNKKYKIIYADPPWSYQDKGCNGNCESHYKTLSIKDLCSLPIKNITDENCVLFLWTTYPILKEALQLIEAWGFKYKSIAFQWVKKNKKGIGWFFGLGKWTRGNTEPCLIAVKGKPTRVSKSVFQIIESPIRGHSRKPDETYNLIERLMGKLPRIELFARTKMEGWDSWGDEVPTEQQNKLTGMSSEELKE